MEFTFTDNRKWKYVITIDEEELLYFKIKSWDDTGHLVHQEEVPFFDDVFNWRPYHLRSSVPLISKEAREFCERSIKSYMKLKAFW